MIISRQSERKEARLSWILVSSYLARGTTLFLPLILTPLILSRLGIEFYGLIGTFAIIQSAIALLDLGIVPTVARELAVLRGRNSSASEFHNTLYTIQAVYFALAAIGFMIGLALSTIVAIYWINSTQMGANAISVAFAIMCLGATANLINGLFSATLMTMGKQLQCNLVSTCLLVLAAFVSAIGLLYFSWGLIEYVSWQTTASWVTLLIVRHLAWRSIPRHTSAPLFQSSVVVALRKFATGVSITQVLATLSMNMDRILLSRLLPTDIFGYYTLAATLSSSLMGLVYPILAVASPRLTMAFHSPDAKFAANQYHFYSQLVTAAIIPATMTVIFFAEPLLLAWTQNADVVHYAATPLKILVLGWLFNGLMCIPYATQLAHGLVRLGLYGLAISLTFQVPALLFFIPRYGMDAAAWSWLIIELSFFLIAIPIMHRRILKGHASEWYLKDTIIPGISGLIVVSISFVVFQQLQQFFEFGRFFVCLYLGISAFLGFLATAISAAALRPIAVRLFRKTIGQI